MEINIALESEAAGFCLSPYLNDRMTKKLTTSDAKLRSSLSPRPEWSAGCC